MKKEEKIAPVITGFILYILAAFISVGLLTQLPSLDNGNIGSLGGLASFARILVNAYGFSSVLIPVFLLAAGTLCFLDKWNRQRACCLLISVVPFFTFVLAEKICRESVAYDTGIVAAVKTVSILLITVVVVIVEYLVTSIITTNLGKIAEEKKEAVKSEEIFAPDKKAESEDTEEITDTEESEDADDDEISRAVDESVNQALSSDWTLKELLERKKKENGIGVSAEENAAVEEKAPVAEGGAEENTAVEENADVEPADVTDEEKNPAEEEVTETEEPVPVVTLSGEVPAEKESDEIDINADPWNISGNGERIKCIGKVIKPSRKNAAEEYTVDTSKVNFSEDTKDSADSTNTDVAEAVDTVQQTDVNENTSAEESAAGKTENTPAAKNALTGETDEINRDALSDIMKDFSSDDDFIQEDDPAGLVENDSFEIEEDVAADAETFEEDDSFADYDDSSEEDSVGEDDFSSDEDISAEEDAVVEDASLAAEDETAVPEADVEESGDIFGDDPFAVFDEIDNTTETEKKTEVKKQEPAVSKEPPVEEKKTDEKSHSLISSLDSVFARMDEDAMADVNAAEKTAAPQDNNNSEIKTSVPVSSVSSLMEKSNNLTAKANEAAARKAAAAKPARKIKRGVYKIPYDLLTEYTENPYWIIDEETNIAAQNLKDTMNEFKIEAEITGIKKGPVVTMFEMLPAPGVKLSKIVALQDNIALRLAASSVRIVAPIPGKRAVGIEVPNAKRAIVSFRECIEQNRPEWKKMAVPVVLGKDIQGETQIMDLVKTPHLLIAGSTGAGKSVCVNSMILSILYKRSPNEVKMILIDPKIVELKLYNDIPHLLTPVITESKKAMQALQYCLCEMERRYALLDGLGVRDISNYNKRIEERKICTEKLPYIVVIIDEFADLMATTGKELESVVARLAAMSRAVGIHLVLATQRPSIDVITGLIKANIPSRIAFMVASKTDSRIIIDQVGADKLLGKGDMLYASATDPFPVRIQGTFISDNEVESVVESVKEWGEPDYIDDEIFIDDEDDGDGSVSLFNPGGEDPLYEKALDVVIQAGKASASYIQRRLKIGYNRAARLVEEMEERGIVGPANGSKPREIIHMP